MALTAHRAIAQQAVQGDLLLRLEAEIREKFGIGHTTIQIETEAGAASCRLRSDWVV